VNKIDKLQHSIHTVDGEPGEDGASLESTLDFINPVVIESHPRRTLTINLLDLAGLGRLPEIISHKVAPCGDGVPRPAATSVVTPDSEGVSEYGTLWF